MPRVKIGVFDSGVGALPVINAIQQAIPDLEIVYKDDKKHLPYGDKTVGEIHSFVQPIFQEFIDEGCQVIVVACNTVTTNLIDQLRKEFPQVPMVGMEPAVKPAALITRSGIIAVCATPRTLASERYSWLKKEYAGNVRVLEPDCSDWALMIENDRVDRQKVANTVNDVCAAGADVIVLGCTHYHWIEKLIKEIAAGRAAVIQPEKPVINQLKRVLAQLP
ncbi:MAG TPA: aspartate/glutamate racemase family protein [Candidatus Saccharimonadales bacterium]|nr:aspartate/glutamate racemase family protein [Candidatus Saccharimonadales bacterium]